ncbi:cfem domain containing protein [Niveomyces insectorum RCEF 264]|uniref:Cfem domain containing protein n=1 Tax=Niveomyces insectorum RCEF 264 TaxID=1081102 RepID=A0A167XSE4_9HYPO|nr:cfem domain containing protein [Niveomyces insectorum RCEF 264]
MPRFFRLAATVPFLLADVFAPLATAAGTATSADGASPASSGTIRATGTTLPELVTESEPCAVLCYDGACKDSGCAPADFSCVCGNPHSLVVKMGLCVGNGCDDSRQFDSGDWIANVCKVYSDRPASADVSRASSLILAEISSASATATNNPATASLPPATTPAATTGASGTAASLSPSSSSTTTSAAGVGNWGRTPAVVGVVGGAVAVAALVVF